MRRSPSKPTLSEEARSSWRETYEHTAYRELPWFSPRPYPWVRTTAEGKFWRPGARILDVGCGAGTNALFLARSGYQAFGVDLAPVAIRSAQERAKRAGLRAEFRVSDALDLPFEHAKFDGVIDVGCFHTLPVELREPYSVELARVLRPGGLYALAWIAREFTGDRGPPHRPSVSEVARVFERRFQMVRTEYLPSRGGSIPAYGSLLRRRERPQPPQR